MKKQKIPQVMEASESRFEAAREALLSFRAQNSEVIDEYEALVAAYNDAYDTIKTHYRDNHEAVGPRFGDFRCSVRTEVDAELLLELMPNAEGAVKIKYSIDKPEYDKLVNAGLIPREIVDRVESPGTVVITGPKRP